VNLLRSKFRKLSIKFSEFEELKTRQLNIKKMKSIGLKPKGKSKKMKYEGFRMNYKMRKIKSKSIF
jgi:hypothetical protein